MPEIGSGEDLPRSIRVEELTERDYEATAALIRETTEASWKGTRPDELNRSFQEKYTAETVARRAHEGTLWVAKDEQAGELLGVIGLKGHELRTSFVHPKAQGSGVGRMLFEKLKAQALADGKQKISLEGSEVGKPIYEHFGFRPVETATKERNGVQYQDTVMELDLLDKPER